MDIIRPELALETIKLYHEDPLAYGFLEENFKDVGEALLETDRSYVTMGNIEKALEEDINPRAIGQTMQALEKIGAVDLWSSNSEGGTYQISDYDGEVYREILDSMDLAENDETY